MRLSETKNISAGKICGVVVIPSEKYKDTFDLYVTVRTVLAMRRRVEMESAYHILQDMIADKNNVFDIIGEFVNDGRKPTTRHLLHGTFDFVSLSKDDNTDNGSICVHGILRSPDLDALYGCVDKFSSEEVQMSLVHRIPKMPNPVGGFCGIVFDSFNR